MCVYIYHILISLLLSLHINSSRSSKKKTKDDCLGMSRHSKNNTAHSIFTYHERKLVKDVGTLKERLGSESQRQFHFCWLCLHTAVKPVCTPAGYLYCRRCIILNLAEQKKNRDKDEAVYELQQLQTVREKRKREVAKESETLKEFAESELGIPKKTNQASNRITKKEEREYARSKNFWIPEMTPSPAELPPLPAPSRSLVCPMSDVPLRVKDLVDIKGTTTDQPRWKCSLSGREIAYQKTVLIKPTGQLVLEEYLDNFVLGNKGFYQRELTKKDILPILSGGTGFCAHNKVEAQVFRPVLR